MVGASDDHRDPAPHAVVELGHLQPYVAAPDHSEALRKLRFLQPVRRLDVIYLVQALYGREKRARTRIEDDLPGEHGPLSYVQPETLVLAALETGVATDQGRVVGVFEALLQAAALEVHYLLRPLQHGGEIDANLWYLQPVLGRAAGLIGDPGGGDDGLGGSAPEVHAGAAKVLAFGQRDGHPFRRQLVGKGMPACPPPTTGRR